MTSTADLPLPTWLAHPFINPHCALGEGPSYEASTHTLRFVDIKKKHLHTVSLTPAAEAGKEGENTLHTLELDTPISITADIEGVDPAEKILIGAKYGLAVLNRKTGAYKYVARFEDAKWEGVQGEKESEQKGAKVKAIDHETMRSNDGTVDTEGRFWVGTMTDFPHGPPKEEGTLYRLGHDLTLYATYHPVRIPNGLAIIPSTTTPTLPSDSSKSSLYFTDSANHRILHFHYTPSSGSLSHPESAASPPSEFYKHPTSGEPDGLTLDEEGYIWHAIYGEGKVLRISPEGKVVGVVQVPTRCVTCPLFVGDELYITSAQEEDPDKYPESAKFGGAVFKVQVGVKGFKGHAGRGGAETVKFGGDKSLLDV